MPPDPRFYLGVRHFNDEEFFEAHEAWEDYWLELGGPERRFYQGLIQAAVSCHHYRRGNRKGMETLFEGATAKLTPYLPVCEGLDLARFLNDFAEWHGRVAAPPSDGIPAETAPFPKMHLLDPPHAL